MNIIRTKITQKFNKLNRLKTALFLLFLINFLNSRAQQGQSVKIHVGLIYPISSNGSQAPLDTNNISVNLIAGISSVEQGFSFAGLSNIVRNNTYGTQFAGFSNHIGKKIKGLLFAGFMNTYGEGNGITFAGFSNIGHGNLKGA